MSKWIGTSNKNFSPYAMEELRRTFTTIHFTQLVPGEVFLFDIPMESDEVGQQLSTSELIFLRHVQPIDREFALTGQASDVEQLVQMISYIESSISDKQISIHIRTSRDSLLVNTKAEIKEVMEEAIVEAGGQLVLQNPDLIIAIYAHHSHLYVGFGTVEEMRSDWPGGAIRFQREEGQASRAKFKLLEAEKVFGLDLALFKQAIDVGAAPGGWSSLLLERGLKVTAIDPAVLDEQIMRHPALTHLKMNASDVKLPKASFDLIVCDMSWNPLLMSKLVLGLRPALKPYSYGVITLKLMNKKVMQSIREVKERLGSGYNVLQAKQLFHNRDEITLLIQKNG